MDSDTDNLMIGKINSQTTAFALIGKPVHHSLSPLLHNTAFQHCRLNCCYLAFEIEPESVSRAMEGVSALGLGGLNVTSPYKEDVIPYLHEISPEAKLIQSVNTIVNHKGKLFGYSTDGPGFCRFLREDTETGGGAGHSALIIGAGGAARAVAFALAGEGVKAITIANRTVSKAREMANLIRDNTALKNPRAVSLREDVLGQELKKATLVINCLAFDAHALKNILSGDDTNTNTNTNEKMCTFVDLRYSPENTELMELFRRRGGQAYNGKGMLLWQAVMAFELFTEGVEAPVEEMRRAINI